MLADALPGKVLRNRLIISGYRCASVPGPYYTEESWLPVGRCWRLPRRSRGKGSATSFYVIGQVWPMAGIWKYLRRGEPEGATWRNSLDS